MAEYLTQSRPYAAAIFEIAEQDNSVDSWIKDLALISTSFQDNLIQALIDTPDISQREKAEKFVSIFEGEVSAKTINFLKTLGQANRLKILDNIILNFLELVSKKRNQKNVAIKWRQLSVNLKEKQLKIYQIQLKIIDIMNKNKDLNMH